MRPLVHARSMALVAVLLTAPVAAQSQSWQTFPRPSFPDEAKAAVVHRGQLVPAGLFTTIHEAPIRRVARWDGRRWQGFGPGPDVGVWAMTVYQGDLMIAGRSGTTALVQRWPGERVGRRASTVEYPRSLRPVHRVALAVHASAPLAIDSVW